MELKLMYITNSSEVASIAEQFGVNRIMIDMETYKKSERQGGMDTVQNRHTLQDVNRIRKILRRADLVVRINPIHEETDEYCSSKQEVDEVIKAGADCIMLPYFKDAEEVEKFLKYLRGRAKNILLLETETAVDVLDDILNLRGIDEIHIGLNDLSLCMKKKFMFEPLADGTVDKIISKIKLKGLPYGFGGIASVGKGVLPAEKIIGEHCRLGSQSVILSRSFCDTEKIQDLDEIKSIFQRGVKEIRDVEADWLEKKELWVKNHQEVVQTVRQIVDEINQRRA